MPHHPVPPTATPSPAPAPFPPGDRARRKALFGLLVGLVALPASWLLFSQLERLWPEIVRMEGIAFMAAATLLGGAMAVGPLAAAIGLLLAIWFGVDSVYKPRSRPSPLLDRMIVGAGLLVWFTPALAAFAIIGQALASGRIHFVRPPRDYFLATDPIAFWQGVGFWLIMGGLFAFLAWRYWRGKLFPRSASAG
ncbi:MAG: hypothetical protein PWP40_1204 [Rhodocyclaceae bacterium]|nr:hypothetical protein [Rhodocyclaceae bacterium]